jgi:threonine/homoserine/homoserine lactone efflux protein
MSAMDVAALVLFAGTLLLAAASPGPGVAALVARVVGRGPRGAGYVELAGISVVILTAVFGAYVLAAARARTLFRSTRAMRLLNRAGGTMMAGAAVAVAAK